MEMDVIMKGILDSYPYPIVFVDDTYTIRSMNRYAEYHYYQERERAFSTATTGRVPKSGSSKSLKK